MLYSIFLESRRVSEAKYPVIVIHPQGHPNISQLYKITIHPIFKISQNFVLLLILPKYLLGHKNQTLFLLMTVTQASIRLMVGIWDGA